LTFFNDCYPKKIQIMTKKEDNRKIRREKRKGEKWKAKSGQALLFDKIKKSNDLPGAKIVIEPKGAEKMSEVIMDFAQPFLIESKDEESARKAIGLAILIWNVSLLPESDQDNLIQEICSGLSPSNDATDFSTAMHYVNMLLERKKKYFPNNKRAIIDYQISGSGKSRRLDVASTLSP